MAHDLRAVGRRLEATLVGRSVRCFIGLQGIDRAVVLSSQAFTALIPLLLLVAALAPADQEDIVSAALIRRLELSGESAAAVRQLFAHTGNSATGFLSFFLLFFSGVSLTRRFQGLYQQAWKLEPRQGAGRTLDAALGLGSLVLGISLLYLARSLLDALPFTTVVVPSLSVFASFLLWTTVPWLLLNKRLAWRRLAPAGALTAICTSAYGVASTVFMPRQLQSYSERYGLFGVTLALIGWLLGIALIVVAATAVAAELDRAQDPWARRIRHGLGLDPDPVDAPTPTPSAVPVQPAARAGAPSPGLESSDDRSL